MTGKISSTSSSARAEETKTALSMGLPVWALLVKNLLTHPQVPTTIPGLLTQMLQPRAGLGTPASAQHLLKVSRGVNTVTPMLCECLAPLKWRKVLRFANSKRIHLNRNSLFPGGSHIIEQCQDHLLYDFSFVEPSSKARLVLLFFLF